MKIDKVTDLQEKAANKLKEHLRIEQANVGPEAAHQEEWKWVKFEAVREALVVEGAVFEPQGEFARP